MPPKSATKPSAQRGKEAAANDRPEVDGEDADEILTAAKFDAERLIGSLGDYLLAETKSAIEEKSVPWMKMSQRDQEMLIDKCKNKARSIVAGVVNGVAAEGLKRMHGQLEDAGSFKDGHFILKVSVPMNAEHALILARRSGDVQIVFTNTLDFESAMTAQPEPDQKTLIQDEGETAHDEDGVVIEEEGAAPARANTQAPAPAPTM